MSLTAGGELSSGPFTADEHRITHPPVAGLELLRQVPVLGGSAPPSASVWRIVEVLVALCFLIVTAPLMGVIAAVVLLDSRGPILFRQWRIGKGGKLFRFTKFRTMVVDADQRSPHLARRPDEAELDRVFFKQNNDQRVTKAGRWLRKWSLDELPTFLHVLRGEMALVGPRPEVLEMLKYYRTQDLVKFSVAPGITGLAQVSGRSTLSFHQTLHYDLQYVRTRCLSLDVELLIRTAFVVLGRKGAF